MSVTEGTRAVGVVAPENASVLDIQSDRAVLLRVRCRFLGKAKWARGESNFHTTELKRRRIHFQPHAGPSVPPFLPPHQSWDIGLKSIR